MSSLEFPTPGAVVKAQFTFTDFPHEAMFEISTEVKDFDGVQYEAAYFPNSDFLDIDKVRLG